MQIYSTSQRRVARIGAKTSTTDANNTVVETSMFSAVVPGGSLSTSNALFLTMVGSLENDTGSTRVVTLRAKYGGTVIFLGDISLSSAFTSRSPVFIDLWIYGQGATNSQTARFQCVVGLNSGSVDGGDLTQVSIDRIGFARNLAIDSSVNQTLEITSANSDADFLFRIDSAQLIFIR